VPAATVAITVCPHEVIATCVVLYRCPRYWRFHQLCYLLQRFRNQDKPCATSLRRFMCRRRRAPACFSQVFRHFFLTDLTALAMAKIPGMTAAVVQAALLESRTAYAESLKYVWYTSVPFGVVSIMASISLPSIDKCMTNRIAANIGQ
jgi:hypothetical protein